MTAEFNKNVLHVVNRELGADFDPDAFAHVALWDDEHEWIEMRLRSLTDQTVKIPRSTSRSNSPTARNCAPRSRRSSARRIRRELAAAGLDLAHWWTDREGRFALSLSVVR